MPYKNPGSEETKAAQRAATRRWQEAHPAKTKLAYAKHRLKKCYGLTIEARDAMVEAQGGCACCGSKDPCHKFGWAVDHDHVTLGVRGVLCQPCNMALGHVKDSVDRLRQLIDYLEKYK